MPVKSTEETGPAQVPGGRLPLALDVLELGNAKRRRFIGKLPFSFTAIDPSERQDIGMYYWRRRALDMLENQVRGAALSGAKPLPIPGKPERLETGNLKRFLWTGIVAEGKRA